MESAKAAEATDIVDNQAKSQTIRRLAPWIVLALACCGLYLNGLGSWAFTDPGESYYTEAAREMVECNDWIVPHLNYQIYFSKPILTFWLIAASYKVFGVNEMAARLPFALVASLMVFTTYAATKRLINGKVAFLAALIAASNPLTLVFMRTSPIDLLFCAFLNIAALAFAVAVFANSLPWACALWAALGLAVITKGPAGIVLFGLGTALFLLLEKPPLKTLWTWFLSTRPLLGFGIFAAVVVPWYFAVWKATKGLFLQVFIQYENLARFQGKTNLHKSSLFFFLPVLAYGLAPWSLILAQTVKMTLGEPLAERWFGRGRLVFKSTYRPHMQASTAGTADGPKDGTAGDTRAEGASAARKKPKPKVERKPLPPEEIERLTIYYLSSWSLAIFIFFTLSKTQLDTYIEPIMTPLAVLTAAAAARLCDSQKCEDQSLADKLKFDAKWLTVCAHIFAVFSALAAVGGIAASVMPFMPFYPWHRAALAIAGVCSGVGAVAQFKILKKGLIIDALIAHALTICVFATFVTPAAFQISGHFRQDNMVALARGLKGSRDEVALFGTYMPSAMYYMERPVDYLSEVSQFSAAKSPLPRDGFNYGPTPTGRRQLILGDDKHMAAFKTRPDLHLTEVSRKGDWALYDLENGYAEKPRRLEETFKFLMYAKHSFNDTAAYGPLTVPLGSGDAEWFKYRHKSH